MKAAQGYRASLTTICDALRRLRLSEYELEPGDWAIFEDDCETRPTSPINLRVIHRSLMALEIVWKRPNAFDRDRRVPHKTIVKKK